MGCVVLAPLTPKLNIICPFSTIPSTLTKSDDKNKTNETEKIVTKIQNLGETI